MERNRSNLVINGDTPGIPSLRHRFPSLRETETEAEAEAEQPALRGGGGGSCCRFSSDPILSIRSSNDLQGSSPIQPNPTHMAGWTDSGGSRGRGGGGGGGGGGGFINHGAANTNNNNNNTRWRERRPPSQQQSHHQQQQQQQPHNQQQQQQPHNQQQQQQPHNHQQHQHQHQHNQHRHQHRHNHQQQRYRPVNDNDYSSQPPRDSPSEELGRQQRQQGSSSTSRRRPRPQPTRTPPTFTDHNSPTSAANANANANEPDDKARRNAANFECNVCFEMAGNPVVTKCGHLFCWECLYQWIHIHSNHRECPVCKGQVADDAVIPIYGRGGSAASVHDAPPRPTGARVESSRQQLLQQQAAMDSRMNDDDDNPFDLQEISLGFGSSSLGDAMMSLIHEGEMDVEQLYEAYTNPYPHYHHEFDEVYDYDFLGLRMLQSVGARTQRHQHTAVSNDIMEAFFDNMTTHPDIDFGNRGGRSRRGRARGAPSPLDMAMGSSLEMGGIAVSYRNVGDDPPPPTSTGGSSRPNGGWTERRGRSNRNSNSGGGRGMQNSRRQGAHHN